MICHRTHRSPLLPVYPCIGLAPGLCLLFEPHFSPPVELQLPCPHFLLIPSPHSPIRNAEEGVPLQRREAAARVPRAATLPRLPDFGPRPRHPTRGSRERLRPQSQAEVFRRPLLIIITGPAATLHPSVGLGKGGAQRGLLPVAVPRAYRLGGRRGEEGWEEGEEGAQGITS